MIETLAAVIAHSQIVVAQPHSPTLPAGFEDLDIAVLDWIAVEADVSAAALADMGRAVSEFALATVAQALARSISMTSRAVARRRTY